MRIKALFSLAVLGYAGLALAQATPAQNVVIEEKKTETVTVVVNQAPKPPAFVFELHGFTSMTMYFQDAAFGVNNNNPANGQAALNVIKTYSADKPLFGADVRQTRLNFSVRGPEILGGAVPKAVVEFDMFGGDTAGAFGDVSLAPRIRTAYTELKWASTTLQFGQQNMLIIGGLIPQSLSHIAFPAAYTAGLVGWRSPGIWGYHTFGADTKLELAWAVMRSGWANNAQTDASAAAAGNWTFINAGVASGLPAFEARAKASMGKLLDLWVSGHWQLVDRNGPGVVANDSRQTTMTTLVGTVGMKLDTGMIVLQGNAWYGKNAGPLFGHVLQLSTNPNTQGDIFGYGAWGQVGFNFSKEFSVWYMLGLDHPLYSSVFANNLAVMRNMNQVGMIRYQAGNFAFGLEWLYSRTTYNHQATITSVVVGSATGTVPVLPATCGSNPSSAAGCAIITTNTNAQLAVNNVLTGNQISTTFNYYF